MPRACHEVRAKETARGRQRRPAEGAIGVGKGTGEKGCQGETTSVGERNSMRSEGETGQNGCQGETTSADGRDHGGREEEPGRTVARGRQPRLAEWTMGKQRRDRGKRLPGGDNLGWWKGPRGLEGGIRENGCQGGATSAGGRDYGGRKEIPSRMAARRRQPRLVKGTIGIGRKDRGERLPRRDNLGSREGPGRRGDNLGWRRPWGWMGRLEGNGKTKAGRPSVRAGR